MITKQSTYSILLLFLLTFENIVMGHQQYISE